MAYTEVPTTLIESGDPVTTTLWNTYVRDNFINHESRITSLEGGSAVSYMPMYFEIDGPLAARDDVGLIRLPWDMTVLAGRLIIKEAGDSGTTSIDFEYKRGAGAWTTLFSVKPQTSSTTDYTLNTGTLSVTSLLSGDLLRMNIDTVQSSNGTGASGSNWPRGLIGILEFEKA